MEGDSIGASCIAKAPRFLSTPSGWRATARLYRGILISRISIHALRVEGDIGTGLLEQHSYEISIHALRVEGDKLYEIKTQIFNISIHALRVEGDLNTGTG